MHVPIRTKGVNAMPSLAERVDVVIGVDTHKYTHTSAAVAAATGGKLDELTIGTDSDGYAALLTWAQSHPGDRVWSLEGAGGYGAGLARFLAAAAAAVWVYLWVSTPMTTSTRSARLGIAFTPLVRMGTCMVPVRLEDGTTVMGHDPADTGDGHAPDQASNSGRAGAGRRTRTSPHQGTRASQIMGHARVCRPQPTAPQAAGTTLTVRSELRLPLLGPDEVVVGAAEGRVAHDLVDHESDGLGVVVVGVDVGLHHRRVVQVGGVVQADHDGRHLVDVPRAVRAHRCLPADPVVVLGGVAHDVRDHDRGVDLVAVREGRALDAARTVVERHLEAAALQLGHERVARLWARLVDAASLGVQVVQTDAPMRLR